MPDLDLVAVLVSAVALFVLGAAYYAVLGDQFAQVSEAVGGAPQRSYRRSTKPRSVG